METESGSYGTGRNPQRKGNYLTPIMLLLLSSIVIHVLTLLYIYNQKDRPREERRGLLLEELSTESYQHQEPIKDTCGLGLVLSNISEIQQRYWSLPEGAVIEHVETTGTAYEVGLRAGDLLVQIEDHRIPDAVSCQEILEQYCGNSTLHLVYYRDGAEHQLRISLEDSE